MERVEGTLVSFVRSQHGIARISGNKVVFLPAVAMRKELNGSWHHFVLGEERPDPAPNSKLVMDISPDGKGFIANNWAPKT